MKKEKENKEKKKVLLVDFSRVSVLLTFEGDPRGCVKTGTSPFFCAKPRLSQARALLLPQVFVTLGIRISLWQSYIFVLTFPTKPFFFHKE